MNGVHDIGGTDGLGPVPFSKEEPVWRAEWERTAFGMFAMPFRAGFFGVDSFRHAVEKLHPAVYLMTPYYQHWMHSAEHHGVAKGILDPAEIEERTRYYLENPDAPLPEREDPELLEFVDAVVKAGVPAGREVEQAPAFAVGDQVTVTDSSPFGHTRKARYVRGKTGEIVLAHGAFVYPDSAGTGGDEAPEHVYTVRFTNTELWGEDTAEPNGSVYIDVFEPYIVAATAKENAA